MQNNMYPVLPFTSKPTFYGVPSYDNVKARLVICKRTSCNVNSIYYTRFVDLHFLSAFLYEPAPAKKKLSVLQHHIYFITVLKSTFIFYGNSTPLKHAILRFNLLHSSCLQSVSVVKPFHDVWVNLVNRLVLSYGYSHSGRCPEMNTHIFSEHR